MEPEAPSVETLQHDLDEARETIAHLERRQHIDALLRDADAIDLDAARLLTEHAVGAMDEPDLAMAVQDLRRHKPYLFQRPGDTGRGVMGPRLDTDPPDPAAHAAAQAMQTGSRRDLLAYLRLRRRE